MGIVYDGRCCGCGYGIQNCHCAENRRKFEKYAAELFSNDGKTTGIGAYVIETDGSIHELRFVGDADWYDETITTLSEIRNNVIDEFVQQLKSTNYGVVITNWGEPYAITFKELDYIAEHLKEKINENSSDVCW